MAGTVNTPLPIRDWKGLLRQSLSSVSPELKYIKHVLLKCQELFYIEKIKGNSSPP